MDEEIKQIEIRNIKVPRKPSLVVNNFFTLLTIIIMSVVIIWYVNYIVPVQKAIHKNYKHKIESKNVKNK